MKIIKEGAKVTNKKYRVTCSSCDSILEYFQYEAKVLNNNYQQETHSLGPCPVCATALYNFEPKVL